MKLCEIIHNNNSAFIICNKLHINVNMPNKFRTQPFDKRNKVIQVFLEQKFTPLRLSKLLVTLKAK